MAKQIKVTKGVNFAFNASSTKVKFPKEWFNGQVWELVEGEDFQHPIKGGRAQFYLRLAAKKYYKNVLVSRTDAEGKRLEKSLIIKAVDMSPEERVVEDKRRAKKAEWVKAKAKAEKAKKNGALASTTPDAGVQPSGTPTEPSKV